MDTINNIAQAAAKAVWGEGENKEEPVSGQTGNTAKGEPYDAGNIEPRTTTGVTGSDSVKPTEFASGTGHDNPSGNNYTTGTSTQRDTTETTGTTNLAPLEENYDPAGGKNNTATTTNPVTSTTETAGTDINPVTSTTETAGTTNLAPLEDNYNPTGGKNNTVDATPTSARQDTTSSRDDFSAGSQKELSSSITPNTTTTPAHDTTASSRDDSSAGPHKEFGSSVKPNTDMSAAQQDVRDPSDPQTDPKEAAVKSNVDDTGDGMDKSENPYKVDGPGPRPIADIAKEFGGDAGRAKGDTFGASKENVGDDGDDEDGPQKTSHGEGTGDKYVKSSGLKADGGDFDATNPGAGKEADRLLETKGIHREADTRGDDAADAADGGADGKEKKSLAEKIKAKLHKPHTKH